MLTLRSRRLLTLCALLVLATSGCQSKSNKTKIGKRQIQTQNLNLTQIPTKGTKDAKCLDVPTLLKALRDKKTWFIQLHFEDLALYARESNFVTGEYRTANYSPADFTQLKEEGLDFEVGFTKDLDSKWLRFPAVQEDCQTIKLAARDVRTEPNRPTNPLTPPNNEELEVFKIVKADAGSITYENSAKKVRHTIKVEGASSLLMTTETVQEISDYCNRKDEYFSVMKTRVSWGEDQVPTTLTISSQLIQRLERILTLPNKLKASIAQIKKESGKASTLRIPIQTYLLLKETLSKPADLSRPECPTQPVPPPAPASGASR